jgi:RNA polymerase sigma-70 factor, ECF subfamily
MNLCALEIGTRGANLDFVVREDSVSTEEAIFDHLYEEHSSYVYNTCLGIMGNPDDARDAMQDTFLQVYRSLGKFKGKSAIRTWIHRIAINKCMDMLRSRPKHESVESIESFAEIDPPGNNREVESMVRETIGRMRPDHRVVLTLFYFQEFSYQEIAEMLGTRLSQVRMCLHRARKAFRTLYDDGGDEVEV